MQLHIDTIENCSAGHNARISTANDDQEEEEE